MTKGTIQILGLLAICMTSAASAQDEKKVDVDVKVGPRPGTRESVTVVRPGPGGETQILSTETVKDEEKKGARLSTQTAVEDDTPRKARVIVVPAVFAREQRRRIDRELNERFGITDPGVIENPGYTTYLIDALVNARKFDVLEREDLKSVIKEIDFGDSEYADITKAVKIGQMSGADYIVLPVITTFVVDKRREQVPYVGQRQEKVRAYFRTVVRTVDVKSGKIVASFPNEVERTTRIRERDTPAVVVADAISGMYKDAAIKEAASIVDVTYPIKIVSIEGDNVIVNRGRGAIINGEILKVYAAGEVMVDPDTKESLGYSEAYTGSIKITEVNEKISKGVIIEQKGDIKRLSICRRDKVPTTKEALVKPAPKLD
ncbi:MAG: CsgG/HfaB family protein [bacterium]